MLMISTFNFKRAIIICLLLGFILGLLPLDSARAEADMVLKDFTVDVWPEYDDPRVLAIYQGTFVNNGSSDFDGYVKFNIPKEAQINMACEIVNGNHLCQPYKTEDKGDYVELKWKTTKIIKPGQEYPVFLEFYYDPIQDKPEKSFNYIFRPSYSIQQLNMFVKQPLRTEQFTIQPQAELTKTDSKGFTTHKYSYGSLKATDTVQLQVSYVKKDNEPSIKKQTPNPSTTANTSQQNLPQTEAWKSPVILIIVLIFALVLGGFIVYALFMNKKKVVNNKQKKSKSKSRNSNPELLKEKKKLRQMLIKGQISEATYQELVADLEEEYRV